ncbi:MAG: hypothetical protein PHG85_03980 [Candidatus Altiarchaeota archaeon]|nr:hypothetical protein [Candidatus Altiarchaeota archaeon]
MKKPHGIRKHGAARVYYLKSECSNCGAGETLACYEDSIDKRSFHNDFWECPNCFRIYCGDCLAGWVGGACPHCANVKLVKLTPLEVYRCNLCFNDEKIKFCQICRYPHLKKRKKD